MEKRIKELEYFLKEKDNFINNLENEKKKFLTKNKQLEIEYNNINEKLNQMDSESKEQINKKRKINKRIWIKNI